MPKTLKMHKDEKKEKKQETQLNSIMKQHELPPLMATPRLQKRFLYK
jgi:hypothetical protein